MPTLTPHDIEELKLKAFHKYGNVSVPRWVFDELILGYVPDSEDLRSEIEELVEECDRLRCENDELKSQETE